VGRRRLIFAIDVIAPWLRTVGMSMRWGLIERFTATYFGKSGEKTLAPSRHCASSSGAATATGGGILLGTLIEVGTPLAGDRKCRYVQGVW
jgi:hypothetical protein